MILEIPFVHTISGYRRRERTPVGRDLVAFAPVRLREIGDADAPVVARCRYPTTRPAVGPAIGEVAETLHAVAAEAETDYRLLDGRLMRRAVLDVPGFFGTAPLNHDPEGLLGDAAMGAAIRAAVAADGVVDVTADLAQSAMRLHGWAMTRGAVGPVPRKPGDRSPRRGSVPMGWNDLARIASDDRRERAAEMARAMTGAALVDGALYLPSFGPAWQVTTSWRAGDAEARAIPELARIGGLDALWTFPCGDRDAVEAAWERAGRGRLEWSGDVEILDPDALVLPPEEFALRAVGAELLGEHDGLVLKMGSPAALRALADVMEVCRDPDADPGAMVPALRTLAAEYGARFAPGEAFDWMREAMETVLGRVERRRAAPGPATPGAGPRP